MESNNHASKETSISDGDASEGEHRKALENAIELSIKKCVSANRFSDFVKYYPKVYKKKPQAMKVIFQDYTQQLSSSINDSVGEIYVQEEQLSKHLITLDKMSKSDLKPTSYKAWRPTNVPIDTLEDHLLTTKQLQLDKLRKFAVELESQNIKVEKELKTKRSLLNENMMTIKKRKSFLIGIGHADLPSAEKVDGVECPDSS